MAEARKTTARAAGKAAKTAVEIAANNGDVAEAADGAETLRQVGTKSGDLGMGFLGLAMSLWSGAYAYSKFRQVLGKGPILPEPPK
jgi:hypothetical protein